MSSPAALSREEKLALLAKLAPREGRQAQKGAALLRPGAPLLPEPARSRQLRPQRLPRLRGGRSLRPGGLRGGGGRPLAPPRKPAHHLRRGGRPARPAGRPARHGRRLPAAGGGSARGKGARRGGAGQSGGGSPAALRPHRATCPGAGASCAPGRRAGCCCFRSTTSWPTAGRSASCCARSSTPTASARAARRRRSSRCRSASATSPSGSTSSSTWAPRWHSGKRRSRARPPWSSWPPISRGRRSPAWRATTCRSRSAKRPALALRQLARAQGATPFMVLLASFALLLHRSTGQSDLLIGTPVASRNRKEIEGLIGSFANTLVLRSRYAGGATFAEHLAQVKNPALVRLRPPGPAFERLVEEIHPPRDLSRNPLFQVMFALLDGGRRARRRRGFGAGARSRDKAFRGRARPLQGRPHPRAGRRRRAGTRLPRIRHRPLPSRDGRPFRRRLRAARPNGWWPRRALKLEEVDLLSAEERRQHLVEFQRRPRRPPPRFRCRWRSSRRRGARRTPSPWSSLAPTPPAAPRRLGAPHLRRAGRRLRRARRPPARRSESAAATGSASASSGRSEAMAAFLAVWRAGAAYVRARPRLPGRTPGLHDRATPASRLLLTQERLRPRLPAGAGRVVAIDGLLAETSGPGHSTDEPLTGDDLAYVIYTSGSTGRPKGVLVPHRGLKPTTPRRSPTVTS